LSKITKKISRIFRAKKGSGKTGSRSAHEQSVLRRRKKSPVLFGMFNRK